MSDNSIGTMWYCSSFTVELVCNIILSSTAIYLSDLACGLRVECVLDVCIGEDYTTTFTQSCRCSKLGHP